jgi:hypothetical protein
MSGNFITTLGISIILIYSFIKIFQFYGVDVSSYGPYLSFYIFLLFISFILPKYYTKLA